MLISAIGATNIANAALRLICAAIAAWCAIALSVELLARLGLARFYESWLPSLGPLFALMPVVFALLAGFVFGLILGLIFRSHAVRVAAFAGCLGAAFMLSAGVDLGWIASSVGLVIGFLAGGATSDRLVHA